MNVWWAVPFILQAGIMFVDEGIHERRGLKTWERVGHPVDSISVMACYFFLNFMMPTPMNSWIYLVLAVLSTALITKDEWVHAEECGPLEQWLHSLLFILHPITLFIAWWLWREQGHNWLLVALPWMATGFFIYQTVRWNILWRPR